MSDAPQTLKISTIQHAAAVIVKLAGEIDLRSSPGLRSELLQLSDRKPAKVVINLEGITYVDSSGVGTLVEFKRRSERGGGGRVVLFGLQPRVRSVFEITKLDQFFTIVGTLDEALQK